MLTDSTIIYGTGGHGKVVLDAMLLLAVANPIVVVDDNPSIVGDDFLGYPVQHANEIICQLSGEFHIAIGNNRVRARLFQQLLSMGFRPKTIAHPQSIISRFANISTACFVAANTIIGPKAHLETGVIANHGAVIDHDCIVGAFSHIAPNATLGGGVSIGKQVLIGAGAVILPGISVGDNSTVGAGAVINKNIPENATVVGVPGKVIHMEITL